MKRIICDSCCKDINEKERLKIEIETNFLGRKTDLVLYIKMDIFEDCNLCCECVSRAIKLGKISVVEKFPLGC